MDFDPKAISFYLYFLISVVSSTAEECIKASSCSCTTSKHRIDLNPLLTSQNPRFSTSTGGYTYEFQPCVNIVGGCASVADAAVCQKAATGTPQFNAGLQTSATFSGDPESGSLQLKFTGPDQFQDVIRTSTIKLMCTTTDISSFQFVREDPIESGQFFFTLTTKYACANTPQPSPDKPKGGLSTGSILLILFFVFLAVYFVGGILFLKFMRGAQGTEMVPNYGFWTELPGLVKDGVRFTCRGCKTDSSYSQI